PKMTIRTATVVKSNFDKTANIEQEHTLILIEYQFGVPIPSYFKYSREPQPIQNSFFLIKYMLRPIT
ncbi:21543_t:CDS:1, partial [Gigaspora margarita]